MGGGEGCCVWKVLEGSPGAWVLCIGDERPTTQVFPGGGGVGSDRTLYVLRNTAKPQRQDRNS